VHTRVAGKLEQSLLPGVQASEYGPLSTAPAVSAPLSEPASSPALTSTRISGTPQEAATTATAAKAEAPNLILSTSLPNMVTEV
jgi:hypothetical protein